MVTHSSILAWRIPWTEEPGGLQFMGLQRVGHDWSDLAHMHSSSIFNFLRKHHTVFHRTVPVYRRRQWHPTPVLLPGKSHGWRSLVGCSPWGRYNRTRLSVFTFTFHFRALEKEMATHSSVLAWRIPGMGEPGGLLSVGSHRVGHDWSDLAAAAAPVYIPTSSPPFLSILTNTCYLFDSSHSERREVILHSFYLHFPDD